MLECSKILHDLKNKELLAIDYSISKMIINNKLRYLKRRKWVDYLSFALICSFTWIKEIWCFAIRCNIWWKWGVFPVISLRERKDDQCLIDASENIKARKRKHNSAGFDSNRPIGYAKSSKQKVFISLLMTK